MKIKNLILVLLLLLALPGRSEAQKQSPPTRGHIPTFAFVAKKANGQFAYGQIDGAGNFLTAGAGSTLFTQGQALPLGYVVPYAPLVQDTSGNWHFLQVDSNGNLLTTATGGTGVSTYTVATLPGSPATNTLGVVTDGNGVSCTVGGGTTRVLCQFNGSSWVVVGGSVAGNPAGSLGQIQAFGAGSVFAGVPGMLMVDAFAGADVCARVTAAIAALPATGGVIIFSAQNYAACAATLSIVQSNVTLKGAGGGNPFTGNTGATTLNFPAGVTGIDITGDYVKIEDMFLKSASTVLGTDDGIRVRGSRTHLSYVTLSHFGRNGVRVDGSGGQIADFWNFENLESNYNLGDGYQWAAGCSDNHAGKASRLSAVANGGWGFNLLCAASNIFESSHVSLNTLGGYSVSSSTNYFFNTYAESGTGSSFVFQTGAAGNRVWFGNFGQPQTITDTTGSSNQIFYSDPDLYLAQDKMDIGPVPGSTGATNYALGSGQYANSDLSIYDRTNGAYLFHYNPTTKWSFTQRVLTTSSGTLPALNIGSVAGDPSTLVNGDFWYDSTGNHFRCREGGVSVNCIGSGVGAHNLLSATHTDTLPGSPVLGDLLVANSTSVWTKLPAPTTVANVPHVVVSTPPSEGTAGMPGYGLPGVAGRAVTLTTANDTIAATDCNPKRVEYIGSVAVAITLPTATTLAVPNCVFKLTNQLSTVNDLTITTTTWTCNGGLTCILHNGEDGWFYVDPDSATNWRMDVTEPALTAGANITLTRSANSLSVAAGAGISGLTTGFIPKAGSSTSVVNSLCDEGITTANTLTCTDTAGLAIPIIKSGPTPPACTGTGFWCATEGPEFTNVAGAAGLYPDSTQHEYFGKTNGASTKGMMVRVQPGAISSGTQTAAISTATLCASAAGACNTAGDYTVEWNFTQVGTACGTPGTGGVTFLLTWTDRNGTAHSAISLSMDDSASLVATTGTFHFTTSNATAWATGAFNLSSNGSIIQYATGYTACGVGTGSYQLDAWVTRKE